MDMVRPNNIFRLFNITYIPPDVYLTTIGYRITGIRNIYHQESVRVYVLL